MLKIDALQDAANNVELAINKLSSIGEEELVMTLQDVLEEIDSLLNLEEEECI